MYVKDGVVHAEEGEKWDPSVMKVNVSHEQIVENIRANIAKQLPQLVPHPDNPQRIAIVGGGWSLTDTFEELRQLYFEGVALVAVNGSARWLTDRNMKPSVHIVLDARPQNLEFLEGPPIPGCQYLLASQVDPILVDACADRPTRLFHATAETSDPERAILDEFYNGRWFRVPCATSVGLTSVMVMRVLGFEHQHLFGIDSCNDPRDHSRHHGYPQAINDGEGTAVFAIAGKEFICTTWQASQIDSFKNMLAVNGEALNLTVHGDGALAHILRYAESQDASG
jgi:hypothetical protein